MIVKICGIKTLFEALTALEAGADMLGFNFYPPSPRYLTVEDCARIISALQAMGKKAISVGVFVNEAPQRISEILTTCALDLAQLSGNEFPDYMEALKGRAFKAVRPTTLTEADDLLRTYTRQAAPDIVRSHNIPGSPVVLNSPVVLGSPALLVDASVKGAYGGTGETGNWAVAHHLALLAPILLAGGLTPQNVGMAIQAVHPWGVDVASGVESSPGVKDVGKIAAFVAAARASQSR